MQSDLTLSGYTLGVSNLFKLTCFSKCAYYYCSLLVLVCWERSRQGANPFRRHHTNQVAPGLTLMMRGGCVIQSHPAEKHILNKNISGSR